MTFQQFLEEIFMGSNYFQFITLFLLTFVTLCVIINSIAITWLFIKIKASELSTHKLEYVPIKFDDLDPSSQSDGAEFDDEFLDDPAIAKLKDKRKRDLI